MRFRHIHDSSLILFRYLRFTFDVFFRERSRGGGGMGGLGGGGQGEKEIILQQSRIDQKIRKLKNQIERIKHTRNVHRSHRQRIKIPVVAVVGYTNAGYPSKQHTSLSFVLQESRR